jgi:hypothetical protein
VMVDWVNAGATGGSFTVLVFANRLSSGLDIAYKLQRLQLQATFAGDEACNLRFDTFRGWLWHDVRYVRWRLLIGNGASVGDLRLPIAPPSKHA